MARQSRRVRRRLKPNVRTAGPALTAPSWWERRPERVQHGLAILFLLLVTLGFFWGVTFGGHALVGSDTIQWRGMAQAMFEYEEEAGQRALWAPNGFSGMPGYLIHYPKEVLQIDRLPAWFRNLGWWPGAHFFVLLLGTYLLVVFLTRDVLAGALSAVAFGLTSYIPIILAAGHNTKFVALAFAPWLILTFLFALRRPPGSGWVRAGIAALLFAIAVAANLRAEHVQITYYVVAALGIVWLVEGVGSVRDGTWKSFGISTGILAVGSVIALLMVAHPYMATAEYRAFTIRGGVDGTGGLGWDYAMMWSQGIGELLTLLVPNAFGSDGLTYWGPKPFTAGPHYVGGIVLLLACLGLYGVRRRVIVGFGIAIGVMILFSLGEHFELLNRAAFAIIPLFDAFRVPETWLAVVALVAAVLAGVGVYYLGRRESTPEAVERKTRAVQVGLVIIGGFLLVMLLGRGLFFSFESPGEVQQLVEAVSQQSGVPVEDPIVEQTALTYLGELKDERRSMFSRDVLRALVFVGFAGGLILLQRRRRIPSWVMQVGLLALITVDLWQVDRRYFNTDHPAVQTTADVQRLIPQYGVDRYIRAQVEVAGGPGHFRTLPLALNPFNDGRTPYFYESVGGYHGAKLALYQDYIDHLIFAPEGGFEPHGLDLTATRYIISSAPIPGFEQVFTDETTGLIVLEHPDPMPRAWLVDDYEVIPDREERLLRLRDPALDLRSTVILNEQPDFEALPASDPPPTPVDTLAVDNAELDAAAPQPSIELVRYGPREIVWQVHADAPRIFVASEVHYPAGWTARIGGETLDILPANHFLRAVVMPEGSHLLSMRFEPPTHRLSVAVSLYSTLLAYVSVLFLIGFWWYRRGEGD